MADFGLTHDALINLSKNVSKSYEVAESNQRKTGLRDAFADVSDTTYDADSRLDGTNLLWWYEAEVQSIPVGALGTSVNGSGESAVILDVNSVRWLRQARALGSTDDYVIPFSYWYDRTQGAPGDYMFSSDVLNSGAADAVVALSAETCANALGLGATIAARCPPQTIPAGETARVWVRFTRDPAVPYVRFRYHLAQTNASVLWGRAMLESVDDVQSKPGTYRHPSPTPGTTTSEMLASGAVLSGHIGANQVLGTHIAAGQVGNPHLATGSVDTTKIGALQVQNGNLGLLVVGTANIALGQILDEQMAGSTLTPASINPTYKNGISTALSVRTTDGSAGSAQPFCSTPFMHLPREERLGRLTSRRALKERLARPLTRRSDSAKKRLDALEEVVARQGEVILELSNLLMDYRSMTGDEREEELKKDTPWAREYKAKVMPHEHPEAAREWEERAGKKARALRFASTLRGLREAASLRKEGTA